jgi:hypothetical protein
MGFSGVIPKPLERGLVLTVIADTLKTAAEKSIRKDLDSNER